MKKAIEKNIFEEINRTIELKNKLTVAKNNINKVIVRGGGKQSQTLEEIAGNIEGMVAQYNKIARGNIDIVHNSQAYGDSTTRIHTNCDFEIKEAIIIINAMEPIKEYPDLYVSSKIWYRGRKGRQFMHLDTYSFIYPFVEIEGSDILFITQKNSSTPLYIKGWIAIG